MSEDKKYYMNRIKKYKLIEGNEEFFPNGDSKITLHLSHELEKEESTMTINQLAKEMREGFKSIHEEMNSFKSEVKQEMNLFKSEVKQEMNLFKSEVKQEMNLFKSEVKQEMNTMKIEINTRLDKIELRLDAHDAIFQRNNLS